MCRGRGPKARFRHVCNDARNLVRWRIASYLRNRTWDVSFASAPIPQVPQPPGRSPRAGGASRGPCDATAQDYDNEEAEDGRGAAAPPGHSSPTGVVVELMMLVRNFKFMSILGSLQFL
jgi:hypothetical protein